MIKISFCIPTLNRASALRTSLESIVGQADESVEIVIVDGGSTDDTLKVIEMFKVSFSQIRVYPSESQSGVDRDILQSVAMAQGTFCWLFSDDDSLEPGALGRVLKLIQESPEIAGASLNYIAYDAEMNYSIATVPAVGNKLIRKTHLFFDRKEALSVLGMHLGFISCQVVRRSLWGDIAKNNDLTPYCNSWIIVYMIGKMLERNPLWLYVHDVCIRYRSGNDSFTARVGVYNRQQMTHIAYADTIGSLLVPNSVEYRNVFRNLINDRMARTLAVLKSNGMSISNQFDLFRMYVRRYWSYPKFWMKVLPMFFVPNVLLHFLEKIYREQRKRRTTERRGMIAQTFD
jgi:abequosyltransferase